MENKKEKLIQKEVDRIKDSEAELEKSREELKKLETELKIDRKFLDMQDIEESLKEEVKYGIYALESMILEERYKQKDLEKEIKISRARKQVIDKFDEEEL